MLGEKSSLGIEEDEDEDEDDVENAEREILVETEAQSGPSIAGQSMDEADMFK